MESQTTINILLGIILVISVCFLFVGFAVQKDIDSYKLAYAECIDRINAYNNDYYNVWGEYTINNSNNFNWSVK